MQIRVRNLFFVILICSIFSQTSCRNTKKDTSALPVQQDTVTKDSTSVDTISDLRPTIASETLESVVTNIAKAYTQQNSAVINEYIHPTVGLYIIYRPGALDNYVRISKFSFSKPVPDYHAYGPLRYKGALKIGKLPVYDCGTMKWDKTGFYCNTKTRPTELSQTATLMNEIEASKISNTELEKLRQIESRSYRAILTSDDEEQPFVFHVTKYGANWYITVIDRAYAGCDA